MWKQRIESTAKLYPIGKTVRKVREARLVRFAQWYLGGICFQDHHIGNVLYKEQVWVFRDTLPDLGSPVMSDGK